MGKEREGGGRKGGERGTAIFVLRSFSISATILSYLHLGVGKKEGGKEKEGRKKKKEERQLESWDSVLQTLSYSPSVIIRKRGERKEGKEGGGGEEKGHSLAKSLHITHVMRRYSRQLDYGGKRGQEKEKKKKWKKKERSPHSFNFHHLLWMYAEIKKGKKEEKKRGGEGRRGRGPI